MRQCAVDGIFLFAVAALAMSPRRICSAMRRQDKEETWRCYLQTIPLTPRRGLIQINSRGDASSIVLRHGFNVN